MNQSRMSNASSRKGAEVDEKTLNILKMLNFSECMINKVSYQKFVLKNLSGIKTKFKLSSKKFEPLSHIPPS